MSGYETTDARGLSKRTLSHLRYQAATRLEHTCLYKHTHNFTLALEHDIWNRPPAQDRISNVPL
jgi:hypothetical protein